MARKLGRVAHEAKKKPKLSKKEKRMRKRLKKAGTQL